MDNVAIWFFGATLGLCVVSALAIIYMNEQLANKKKARAQKETFLKIRVSED